MPVKKRLCNVARTPGSLYCGTHRPPEEGMDQVSLNAVSQNGLSYIFGDQSFHRFAPLNVTDLNLTYFPRSGLDDFNLIKKPGLFTNDQLASALIGDSDRITPVGGAHFLSLHTQVFGKEEHREVLKTFLKHISNKFFWTTNFLQ